MKSIVLVSQMVDRFANMIRKYAQQSTVSRDIEDALLDSNYFGSDANQALYLSVAGKYEYSGDIVFSGKWDKRSGFSLIVKSDNPKLSEELRQKLNPGAIKIVNEVFKQKGLPGGEDFELKENLTSTRVSAGVVDELEEALKSHFSSTDFQYEGEKLAKELQYAGTVTVSGILRRTGQVELTFSFNPPGPKTNSFADMLKQKSASDLAEITKEILSNQKLPKNDVKLTNLSTFDVP